MRKDRLNIDIRFETANDQMDRLLDFSRAVVEQNPYSSLSDCMSKITRYMYVMRLNRFNYIIELINDEITISLGKHATAAAVINYAEFPVRSLN